MEYLALGSFDYGLAAEGINFFAVVVATIFSFVLGGYWYYEKTFGARWMKQVGLKKKNLENANMTGVFSAAIVLIFIQALLLSLVMGELGIATLTDGLLFGALVGAGFGSTTIAVQYLYAQRSLELFAIDAGYITLQFIVMATVIGWWQ